MPDTGISDAHARDLKHHITHVIRAFQGLCPCMSHLLRSQHAFAAMHKFMDQSCLGMPRTPNSEITIDVGEDAADFDPIQQAATIDVEEIHSNPIDQCGEHEYLIPRATSFALACKAGRPRVVNFSKPTWPAGRRLWMWAKRNGRMDRAEEVARKNE